MSESYARMTRGVILTTLYIAWQQGLTDPSNRRRMGKAVIETTLNLRATMPPRSDYLQALDWLEGAGYVAVDWAMDSHQDYETVTLTQSGIALYENKRAAQAEPGVALPPRR